MKRLGTTARIAAGCGLMAAVIYVAAEAAQRQTKISQLSINAIAAKCDAPSDPLPDYPSFASVACDSADWNAAAQNAPIQLCQGYEEPCVDAHAALGTQNAGVVCQPEKLMLGVDEQNCRLGKEPSWRDQHCIPWEAFAYGEYIGPHRTPHVGEYRIRVNDQIDFVYLLTREQSAGPYQLYVGDTIQITSAADASLNQTNIAILSDGTVSLALIGQIRAAGKTVVELQNELNERYTKFVKNPAIVLQVLQSDTPLRDLRDSVDARAGQGGQSRLAIVSPDGTVQLPWIGSVPAVGLTLAEIGREVNARYRARVRGIEITPILQERAPRFIYVVGEVAQPGRFELTGPTTAIQALALAGSFTQGGNVRQVIVFRRDQNWRLMATKLDLAGALYGKRPYPSDEIWLRDSDIVLVPKKPIQRVSEAVDLYFTQTFYSVFPVTFTIDRITSL